MLSVTMQTGDKIDSITIGEASATIGRNADNTVVLEDSQRYISGHHAVIDFRPPDYYITDISTNGVLINEAVLPIGDGNSIKLTDGDKISIAEYTLLVSIIDQQQDLSSSPFVDDPFAELGIDTVQEMIDENHLMLKQENSTDPFPRLNLADFDDNSSANVGKKKQGGIIEQAPPAFKDAFQPIKAEKKNERQTSTEDIFARDWFKKNENKSTPSEELFPEDFFAEKKNIIKPSPKIKPAVQLADKPDKANKSELEGPAPLLTQPDLQKVCMDNFLRGAELESLGVGDSMTSESFYIIGKIMRASIQGTMDVLIGRAKIKNEMHLDVTTIKPIENNPVKFSVTVDEAMKKLLTPQNAGYLQAEEAIEEAFDDIRAHQVSVISGMQTALLEVLKRFDPQKLEQRLQKQSPLSASIPIHKQAKLWRLFEHLYDDIEREASDNFYHLFGEAFAESYEQQMLELKNAKKDSPFY